MRSKKSLLGDGQRCNLGALASLPPELLERVLSFIDKKTRLALSGTCKEAQSALLARTTVVNGKNPRTTFKPSTASDPMAAARALQMTAHAAHNVTLYVQHEEPAAPAIQPAPTHTHSRDHAWLDMLLSPWVGKAANPTAAVQPLPSLQQITRIHLFGVQLDHPFPGCIGAACPHLQEYVVWYGKWPDHAVAGDICWPCLQHLEITFSTPLQFLTAVSPSNFPVLAQLRLQVHAREGQCLWEEQEAVAACYRAFSKQLTWCVTGHAVGGVETAQLQEHFIREKFPCLTFINIAWCLQDSDFDRLLTGCPSLKHISVTNLVLKEEHSEHQSLECVDIMRWVGNPVESLSQLFRMPNLQRVSLPQQIRICCMVDTETIARVVGRFKGCFIQQPELRLYWGDRAVEARAIEANVGRMLPLLLAQPAKQVVLARMAITAPLLMAVGTLHVECMVFQDCTWEPCVASRFWALAPRIRDLELSFDRTPGSPSPCLEQVTILVAPPCGQSLCVSLVKTGPCSSTYRARSKQQARKPL